MVSAYGLLLLINLADIPLGMIGVGERPGLWSEERPRPLPPPTAAAAADVSLGAPQPLIAALARGAKEFVSPFWKREGQAFRWFFAFRWAGERFLPVGYALYTCGVSHREGVDR